MQPAAHALASVLGAAAANAAAQSGVVVVSVAVPLHVDATPSVTASHVALVSAMTWLRAAVSVAAKSVSDCEATLDTSLFASTI